MHYADTDINICAVILTRTGLTRTRTRIRL